MRLREASETRVAESPAGPDTPAQAHDFGAAFRAEVWTIIREERQVCEDLSLTSPPDYRLIKQPISRPQRRKSARLKNLSQTGILCRPNFPCNTNIFTKFCWLRF